jgi:hypothetical protein
VRSASSYAPKKELAFGHYGVSGGGSGLSKKIWRLTVELQQILQSEQAPDSLRLSEKASPSSTI